ncbi:MAG TPA: hypothetical protein VM165_21090 [Planctomycetaceae bacterium]|nr:hypothetical protein [Planctomycetaceae bacterium]
MEYDRLVAEWLTAGRRLPTQTNDLRVVELIAAFWRHAQVYYGVSGDGGELGSFKLALHLKRLYGHTPAATSAAWR